MLNVRNLVVDAFKTIGEIGDNESLDGTRTSIGLQLLNEVVTQLNLDNYFAFSMQTVEYTTIASQKEYTIGIAPNPSYTSDIIADRPANINRLYIKNNQGNTVRGEVNQLSLQDLPLVENDAVSTPSHFSYKSTYPLGTIVFNSKPVGGQKVVIVYTKPIPQLGINDTAEIPYEYEPALKYALSYILSKRYGNPVDVIAAMKELRDEALLNIKNNTQRKSFDILHLGNDGLGQNIYNLNGGR